MSLLVTVLILALASFTARFWQWDADSDKPLWWEETP